MTIWLLGLLLLASLAALGFRQGAIRVGVSFIGILLGALLAPALGRLLRPLLMATGLKNPMLVWVLGPLIVFVIIQFVGSLSSQVLTKFGVSGIRQAPDQIE